MLMNAIRLLSMTLLFSLASCEAIKSPILVQDMQRIVIPESALQETYYFSDVLPHCVVRSSPIFEEGKCYAGNGEPPGKELETLYVRLVGNLKRIEQEGGEYQKINNDPYAKIEESTCTLGFERSCALDAILKKARTNISPDVVRLLVTGQARDFYPHYDLEGIYPEQYDPRRRDHFYHVMTSGIPALQKSLESNSQ